VEINYLKAGYILIISFGYILFNVKSVSQISKKIRKYFNVIN